MKHLLSLAQKKKSSTPKRCHAIPPAELIIRTEQMINTKILLLSDNLETAQLWAFGLKQWGPEVTIVGSLEEASETWEKETFDLIIVDLYGQTCDELELCRQLRAIAVNPMLLFTYRGSEPEILAAYQAGVDECIPKPITPPLFMAKVSAWLRRSWTVSTTALETLQAGEFSLDPARRHLIRADGEVIKLTNLEFRLLYLLMRYQGRVIDTNLIVERVWGHSGHGDSALLKNVVYRLRRKVERDPGQPTILQTVPGEGYIFQIN